MTAAGISYRFDLGRVFTRTYNIIARNFMVLGALALLLYGLPRLGAEIADDASGWMHGFPGFLFDWTDGIYGLIAAAGYFALQASVVHGAVADLNGYRATMPECLRTGVRSILPVIGIFFVTVIAVALGLIALIIPGLMILTAWAIATPAAVIERIGVGDAFSRSAELTRGFRWHVLGLIAILAVGLALVGGLVDGVEDSIHDALDFLPMSPPPLLEAIFDAAVALVACVAAVSLYVELRIVKEDATAEEF
ncbi:MAG TPA: hypothetical protein VEC60_17180, partial [Reyranella sp.]|nr:hypothetical protein [Reyranella sp.]